MGPVQDRRSFLLSSAATVSASRLSGQPGQEIRTAFIGVGVRGGGLLRAALKVANVKVRVICDPDPEARDRALSEAKEHNPQAVNEWRKVIDLSDIDAVFVATPCYLHAEMATACLEASKYVYCEKPLGITPEQVDRVVKAARRSKAFLQIGQQLRYYPTVREAIRQIHEGSLHGQTYILQAFRHSGRSRASAQLTAQQKRRADWYADVKQSGDLIVENAVHNIDACNWIANSRPVSAYGHGKKYFPQPIAAGSLMMDGFSVQFIYENDIHCQYSQLSFHPRTMKMLPSGMWYAVYGQKGSIFLTHEAASFFDLYGESEPLNMLKNIPEKFDADRNAVEDFCNAIREKRQPFADITVAATAALSAIMGREAIYRGRSVTWKELGVTL